MTRTCAILLLLTVSSCTLIDWEQGALADEIVLVNTAGEPIFYNALELQSSHLVDPIPSFDPDESPLPRLHAGDAVVVTDIDQYTPGDDVRFFIYTLENEEGGEDMIAVHKLVLTVTDEELQQSNGRVVVMPL